MTTPSLPPIYASTTAAHTASSSNVLEALVEGHDVVRVLLVEDNPSDQEMVERMLRTSGDGAVLTTVERLDPALEPVSRGLADLVVLDLSLPDSAAGIRRLRAVAPEIGFLDKADLDPDTLAKAVRDAFERRRCERRLTRLSLSDPVTGLPNRVLFADRLDQALVRAARSSTRGRKAPRLLVMFIDLDGFKAVNDELGHLAGDALLVEVARRLKEQVRGADTVVRLSGDAFCVLCEGVQCTDGGMALGRRFSARLCEPYALEGAVARVSAAVGIAVAHPLQEYAEALLRRAAAAMDAAKRAGRGRVALADGP